jgi:hypothetical protein
MLVTGDPSMMLQRPQVMAGVLRLYKNDYLIHDPKLPNADESRAVFRASVQDLP